jgi:DNA-binding NarL/FixJ family response regulator
MKILIVEDDPGMGILLRKYLEGLPDTDIEIVEDLPPPDIVTLDLLLPDSAAEQTLAEIAQFKKANPDGCLVVMTGISTDPAIKDKSFAAGADGFITKQVVGKRSEFLNAISNVFAAKKEIPRYQQHLSLIEALTSTLKPT